MAGEAGLKPVAKGRRSPGRHRTDSSPVLVRARKSVAESLFRNSAFLVINLIVGACCGYGALSLLTRLYSVRAVGLSAAAASVSTLIVFITQFGVSSSLPRFLPTSTNRPFLINTMLTFIISATLLASTVFLVLPFGRKFYALGGWLFAVVFVVGACAQAGQSVLGTILISDRMSGKIARANIIPNLTGLAAPSVFSFLGSFGAYLARIASNIVGFIIFGVVLARRGHRFRPMLRRAAIHGLGRFSAGMYLANLLGSLPLMTLPIIILSRFGFKQSAYWSIAMTIASLLYQLSGSVSQALLPEVAHRPRERRHLVRRSAALIVALVIPVLTAAYFVAPFGLELLGHSYVSGALGPLRWLIIAGYITILNYVSGTVLLLAKKTFLISAVNVVDAVVVLYMATVWARGADDVAISWAIGDVFNTVLFGLFAFLAIRQVGGQWETLGSAHGEVSSSADTSSPLSTSQVSVINSQQQALEMLFMLAERQRISARTQRLNDDYRD
jgi:O-antigen/teichoic acid export membrane protein